MKLIRNHARSFFSAALLLTFAFFAFETVAAPGGAANGQGALIDADGNRRQFSFSAQQVNGFEARGNAVLHNPAFEGANGNRYALQVEVKCIKVVGNTAIVGGLTRRTNDPNLVDAVFFAVRDNGEPGKNVDQISRVFFWDDDPDTTGDPMACQYVGPEDFPLETINSGNVQVR